jgi:hypothetical protein
MQQQQQQQQQQQSQRISEADGISTPCRADTASSYLIDQLHAIR